MPSDHPPINVAKPAPSAPAHGAAHDSHGAHDCHGPNAEPHHVNWYKGLLGVNNQKRTEKDDFVTRLLWRYNNPKDECDAKNEEPPVLAAVINLGIVLFLLFKFGKKPVSDALANRKKTIMTDIDAATALRVDAEKRLKSYEKQLGRIEERRKELHEEYRLQWEAERTRILKEAEEKALRLRRDAEFRVAQELKQVQVDLLAEAVEGSVHAAEDLLKTRIQASDQNRLADEFLLDLGKVMEKSAPTKGGRAS